MRKTLVKALAAAAAMIMIIAFTGCGGSNVPERLIGEWNSGPLTSEGNADSVYVLTIKEDGTFSLQDKAAGTGIAGTLKGDDTGKLGILELTCNEKDFNPPVCWAKLQTKSRVRYKIIDENTIKLGYVGIWITFTK